MWAPKWGIASAVLGENALPYVMEHVGERMGAAVPGGLSGLGVTLGAAQRNIACLFPLGYGVPGALAGGALALYAVYFGFVYRRKGFDRRRILVYSIIGLVPYIRYLTLRNHSYLHCFFTYRAQAATALALFLVLEELTERRRTAHGKPGRRA